ncbi:MAG: DMT family transporter [Clostridia bacterium]|nr:DMT family transporter [Clostridia bacterium]
MANKNASNNAYPQGRGRKKSNGGSAFLGVLYVVLASACYGITPILSNAALRGGFPNDFVLRVFGSEEFASALIASPARAVSNETLVALCMGIACVLSFLNALMEGKKLTVSGKQFFHLSTLGGGALAATLLLITYAYLYIPAGMTIVINFTYPVFVLLAGMLFFKEKASSALFTSLLFAIVGIALISSASFSGKVELIGILLALASGVAYAVYFLAGKNSSYASLDSAVSNFYITGAAAILSFIVAVASKRISIPTDPIMWLLLFLEAAFGYIFGLRLLLSGIRILGSAPAAALNTLEPVFASLTSMLVFGEDMGLLKGVGAALVLLGALISIIALRSKPRKARS